MLNGGDNEEGDDPGGEIEADVQYEEGWRGQGLMPFKTF